MSTQGILGSVMFNANDDERLRDKRDYLSNDLINIGRIMYGLMVLDAAN
jgi:hypothetical protein